MSTFTLGQAVNVLSSYDAEVKQSKSSIVTLKALFNDLIAQFTSLLASGAPSADVQAKVASITSAQQSLANTNDYIKTLGMARDNARNVLLTASGVTGATGPTTNPFEGTPGPQGPQGPTGPSLSVDTAVRADSTMPVTSGAVYTSLQSFVPPPASAVTTVTFGTSSQVDPNVRFLCHFDGIDGSSKLYDSSLYSYPTFAYGSAVLSDAQSNSGTTSLFSNIASGGVPQSCMVGPTLRLGTGPFTLECWMRLMNLGGTTKYILFLSKTNIGGPVLGIVTNSGTVSLQVNSGQVNVTPSTTLVANTWNHVAITRDSNQMMYLSVNGTTTAASTDSTNYDTLSLFAAYGGSYVMNGYVDEVRATVGTARYTTNFTPESRFADFSPNFPSTSTQGQLWCDGTVAYLCTAGGSPGTWKRLALENA